MRIDKEREADVQVIWTVLRLCSLCPDVRTVNISSGGTSSYGIRPNVITSQRTTPNDHWVVWVGGVSGVGVMRRKFVIKYWIVN